MALESEVLYGAFGTPREYLRMYSLLRTRCCVNCVLRNQLVGHVFNLEAYHTHAAKDGVQFLYGMQGRCGGWVFAWPVYADMIYVYGFVTVIQFMP
jgi:hypothetical protein